MHGGEDNFLAALQVPAQHVGGAGPVDDVLVLHERLHVVAQLLVEVHAVGDDDDTVEHAFPIPHHPHKLIGEPSDRVALARPRRVLDEVPLTDRLLPGVFEKQAHGFELVPARPDYFLFPLAGVLVLFGHYLRIVLDDVAQAPLRENVFPQIGGLQSVWVDGVAGTVVHALVEWKKPRVLATELGAHLHCLVVNSEVDGAALRHEEQVMRVAVAAILSHGVGGVLTGEPVLQFHGDEGKPIEEQHHIDRVVVVVAVEELPDDAELILAVIRPSPHALLRRIRAVEIEGVAAVLHTLAQHVYNAA